jgi:hypothetical protein
VTNIDEVSSGAYASWIDAVTRSAATPDIGASCRARCRVYHLE